MPFFVLFLFLHALLLLRPSSMLPSVMFIVSSLVSVSNFIPQVSCVQFSLFVEMGLTSWNSSFLPLLEIGSRNMRHLSRWVCLDPSPIGSMEISKNSASRWGIDLHWHNDSSICKSMDFHSLASSLHNAFCILWFNFHHRQINSDWFWVNGQKNMARNMGEAINHL